MGVGRVEQVFGKFCREGRKLFLDGLEAGFVGIVQLGTGKAEVAQLALQNEFAHCTELAVFRPVSERLVAFEQLQVLPNISIEGGDFGQHCVVGFAPGRNVIDAVQVTNHPPGPAQSLSRRCHGFDEVLPAWRGIRAGEGVDEAAVFLEQLADGGCDMLRKNRIEVREVGKIK